MCFISLSEILTGEYPIFAHIKSNEKELLEDHIKKCKFYFTHIYNEKQIDKVVRCICKKMDFHDINYGFNFLQKMLFQTIVFHDFGKINPNFQKKKMKNKQSPESYDGLSGSDHSFLSSLIYIDYFWNEIENDLIFTKPEKSVLRLMVVEHAFIISRHHSDMENLDQYIQKLKDISTQELISNLGQNKLKGYKGLRYLEGNIFEKKLKVNILYHGKGKLSRSQDIIKYFYYRLIYSLLVASDYYATTEFMNGLQIENVGKNLEIDEFRESYYASDRIKSIRKYEREKYQRENKRLNDIKEINDLRSEIFLDTERNIKINNKESIFFLESPTGSGKSNTAINLSFQLMEDGKKLLYIYPFNTLVEQNRQTLQNLFPQKNLQDKIVIVNSLTPIKESYIDYEDSTNYYQKALLDRQFLDYPIILSSHVMFFNLLFGNRKEDFFGFFQLTDAVIVLDEIQSYKNDIWAEIIIFLRECSELMGMKIIIMSATLPNLEILCGKDTKISYLLPNSKEYFQHPIFCNRVELSYELLEEKHFSMNQLMEHVVAHQEPGEKILIEFIKKDSAYEFFQKLSENENINIPVACVTGDDSLYEREKILKPIREGSVQEIILVATQVIEAGVDIDMDIGYKDISKLDSEEQFLGRINRSCKRKGKRKGKVYFFDLDDSHHIYKDDYRIDDVFTLKKKEMRRILIEKNFSEYYKKILNEIKENLNKSTSREGLKYFFDEQVKKMDFPKIAARMELIKESDWKMNLVLCRKLEFEDGNVLNGKLVWQEYKELLQNSTMHYAEKQIKLSKVRSQLNYFIYEVNRNIDLSYNDSIGELFGELYCIFDGEKFFESGKLNRKKVSGT